MKVAIFEGGVRARKFGDRRIPSLEEQSGLPAHTDMILRQSE